MNRRAQRRSPDWPSGWTRRFSEKTAALFPDVSTAAAHAHLPMVNLALGALRHLTADQFTQFSQTLQWLIESDGKVELFEFVLQKIVLRHLGPQFGQGARTVVQYYSLKPLVPDCAVVLSALANVGSNDAGGNSKGLCNRRAVFARAGRRRI